MRFDPHELSNLAKELPGTAALVIEEFNANLRSVFDDEHDKPVDAVLPVVRERVSHDDLDEDVLLAIAELISEGKVPTMARNSSGALTVSEARPKP